MSSHRDQVKLITLIISKLERVNTNYLSLCIVSLVGYLYPPPHKKTNDVENERLIIKYSIESVLPFRSICFPLIATHRTAYLLSQTTNSATLSLLSSSLMVTLPLDSITQTEPHYQSARDTNSKLTRVGREIMRKVVDCIKIRVCTNIFINNFRGGAVCEIPAKVNSRFRIAGE